MIRAPEDVYNDRSLELWAVDQPRIVFLLELVVKFNVKEMYVV